MRTAAPDAGVVDEHVEAAPPRDVRDRTATVPVVLGCDVEREVATGQVGPQHAVTLAFEGIGQRGAEPT